MRPIKPFIFTLTMAFVLAASPAYSASTKDEVLALKEEVKQLKAGQESMKNDLAEIRKLLESGQKPTPTRAAAKAFEPKDISIEGAPFKGQADAVITLVEYSDYQCPFCKRHMLQTHPQIASEYIDQGKVKYVMREFPLTSLHPRAVAASLAALCARDQGKYWEMHDVLFANQKKMTDDDIKGYASEAGLDIDTFVSCMDAGKYNEQVQSDLTEGRGLGITGTPSFALGLTAPADSNQVKVMKVVRGARSYDSFAKEINELLESLEEENSKASP